MRNWEKKIRAGTLAAGLLCLLGAACAAAADPPALTDQQLNAQAQQAWHAMWERFYDDRTHLFYDYLCSHDPQKRLAGLPTPAEAARQYPCPTGWGTGMEDCAISGGLILALICDRFAATNDATLRPFAARAFKGMVLLGTVSPAEGFVVRGVCPTDRKGHYGESSRDQYTWYAYGLWRYYHSPLAQPADQAAIKNILAAICRRLERNIIPANNYRIGREDGSFDSIVDKMWECDAHEIARLPMIYAIGADVTGDSHWRALADRYSAEAAEKSKPQSTKVPYALLQQQVSLEALYQLEPAPALKAQWLEAMNLVSARSAGFLEKCRAYQPPGAGPVHLDWREWPLRRSMGYQVPTRPQALLSEERTIREPAEAALTLLLHPQASLSPVQLALIRRTIGQVDYTKNIYYGHYYTQAAYWRAARLGLLPLPPAPARATDR